MQRAWLVLAVAVLLSVPLAPTGAAAQECEGPGGGTYSVRPGDYLIKIARARYGDAEKWSIIYNTNIEVIGNDPDLIMIGDVFRLPCLEVGEDADASSTALTGGETIKLLTADDYQPFTHRGLLRDGLVTHIVDEALAATGDADDYGIGWVNDWSVHLDDMLIGGVYDMGFPWLKPDCEATPDNMRCSNFLFSEPMFEMLVLLFTHDDRPVRFVDDSDIYGRTLCRPAGYYTHDLDKDGRNWLSGGRITLEQPDSVAECFRMLEAGEVDAVALNEFTGRSAVKDLGMEDAVSVVDTRPLSIEGLHVIVPRRHPQAEALLSRVNAGLQVLRENGDYNRIVDRHLARFWNDLES